LLSVRDGGGRKIVESSGGKNLENAGEMNFSLISRLVFLGVMEIIALASDSLRLGVFARKISFVVWVSKADGGTSRGDAGGAESESGGGRCFFSVWFLYYLYVL
jgi:hypothetical protein